jgi:hypothetical protein
VDAISGKCQYRISQGKGDATQIDCDSNCHRRKFRQRTANDVSITLKFVFCTFNLFYVYPTHRVQSAVVDYNSSINLVRSTVKENVVNAAGLSRNVVVPG